MTIPFPLRPDLTAYVYLPEPLTREDADRMQQYLMALVVEGR